MSKNVSVDNSIKNAGLQKGVPAAIKTNKKKPKCLLLCTAYLLFIAHADCFFLSWWCCVPYAMCEKAYLTHPPLCLFYLVRLFLI